MRRNVKERLALVVGASVLLGACGSTSSDRATDPIGAEQQSQADDVVPEEIISGFTSTYQPDFEPAGSWDALGAMSEVVIVAEVQLVGQGRSVGENENDSFMEYRAMISVTIAQVEKSAPGVAAGDMIYVELKPNWQELQKGLAPGMRLSLFLNPVGSDGGMYVDESQSLAPAGSQIWELASPEGVIVEPTSGDGYVVPYADVVQPSEDVEAPAEQVS